MAYFVHAWLWKHSRTLKIDWHVVNLNHVKLVNTSMVTNISRMPKPQHDSVVTSVWQLSVFVEGFPIKAVKLVFVKRHRATDGLNSAVCETYTPHLRSKTPLDPGEHDQQCTCSDSKKYFIQKYKTLCIDSSLYCSEPHDCLSTMEPKIVFLKNILKCL